MKVAGQWHSHLSRQECLQMQTCPIWQKMSLWVLYCCVRMILGKLVRQSEVLLIIDPSSDLWGINTCVLFLCIFWIILLIFLHQKQSSFNSSENYTVPVYWSFVSWCFLWNLFWWNRWDAVVMWVANWISLWRYTKEFAVETLADGIFAPKVV